MTRINEPSAGYLSMRSAWTVTEDLRGGTEVMRSRGETYLPRDVGEYHDEWRRRLARTFLYPGYDESVEEIVAKPMSQPVSIRGDLPAELKPILVDADRCGNDLTQFAEGVFDDAVDAGMSHILVEFPNTGGEQSRGRELYGGVDAARPYFVHIKARDMLESLPLQQDVGRIVPGYLRWRTYRDEVVDGRSTQVEYIREMEQTEPGKVEWRLWRVGDDEQSDQIVDQGTLAGQETIPLVTVYTKRTGFMRSRPPLLGLAWKNVQHWQKSSDLTNLVHFVSVAILFKSGWDREDLDAETVVGASRSQGTPNPDADMKFVEHSGAGVGAAQDDLANVRSEMEVMGLQPFMRQGAVPTATQERRDDSKTDAQICRWVRALENGLWFALKTAAGYVNRQLSDEIGVDVFDDFSLLNASNDDITTLVALNANSLLSRRTTLHEIKRRGFVGETVDVEDEMAAIDEETDALPVLPGIPEDDDEDE